MVGFAVGLVFFLQHALDLSQIDIDRPVPFALVITDDNLSDFVLELGIKAVLLYFPD